MNRKYLPIIKKRNPESLKNCLDDFKKTWVDLNTLSKINENWTKLVGLELSKECEPLNFEKKILTIRVNNPQWRQALFYSKHKLKEKIYKVGIDLNEIKIVQNYEIKNSILNSMDAKLIWEKHPSRIKVDNMSKCKICNCPTPKGEILRWGKCSFCWRKNV